MESRSIDRIEPGRRGTGRQLRDENGPMFYEDDGEPIRDSTKDAYSVYHVVAGDSRAAKNSGRIIWPDSAHKWQVLPASPLRLLAGDFVTESGLGIADYGMVLSSGPNVFDVVWRGGSTTRQRHGAREIRIIGSAEIDEHTRKHLLGELASARRERRAGAGIRRGQVAPRR